MNALALPFGMLIGADHLLVEIHQEITFILETGIGGNKPDGVPAGWYRGQFFPQAPARFARVRPELVIGNKPMVGTGGAGIVAAYRRDRGAIGKENRFGLRLSLCFKGLCAMMPSIVL